MISIDRLRYRLTQAAAELGSQRELARRIGVSEQFISDVIRGRREPGTAVLRYLELERVVGYQRIET